MTFATGEPVVFKSKLPDNRLIDGGYFNGFTKLPLSDAWRIFGQANGMPTLQRFRERIAGYRSEDPRIMKDPEIGCTLLNHPRIPGCRTAAPVARALGSGAGPRIVLLRNRCHLDHRAHDPAVGGGSRTTGLFGTGRDLRDPHLVATRIGQRSFQALVLDAYHRRCAITGEKIRPRPAGRPYPAGRRWRAEPGGQRATCRGPTSARCSTAATPRSTPRTGFA